MKAILINIRPKWCALMMNGDKTVEVRKGTALYKAIQKLIDENGYADIYVYCTKEETLEYIYDCSDNFGDYVNHKGKCWEDEPLNGKVIFKFRCYKVEEIIPAFREYDDPYPFYITKTIKDVCDLLEMSCLKFDELKKYLQEEIGYAIHISDLEVFDKPKELSEFRKYEYIGVNVLSSFIKNNRYKQPLTKAPQSYMFIEVGE